MCQKPSSKQTTAGEQNDANLFNFNEFSLFLIKTGVKAQPIDPGFFEIKAFQSTPGGFVFALLRGENLSSFF